jgi:hypothetical protein
MPVRVHAGSTNPALDPFAKIPELKFCAARIAPVRMAAESLGPVRQGPANY